MGFGETPWVDRNLRGAWERIAAQVPASWMPQLIPGRKFMVQELGCGHYGCVAPVAEPGMVFKLTSDVTEARFVVMAQQLPETEGIVRYFKIFALGGAEHRKRPLFVLWRQDAKDIGFLMPMHWNPQGTAAKYGYDEYQVRNFREGMQYLDKFLDWAREVRKRMLELLKRSPKEQALAAVWQAFENADPEADPRHYRGVPRIGIALRKCWELAMLLQNTDVVYPVGTALGHYLDEGILLADVHANNIGRDENNQLIITDPGHAVAFHPRWLELPKVQVI